MQQAGTVLAGRYVVEKVLGRGGMGAVYLAHLESLPDKRVAIKEMIVHVADAGVRQQAMDQFRREAQILAGLSHPNLVAVTDFFTEDGSQYLVMDYIQGRTLEQEVNASPTFLDVPPVLAWMEQVCDVLGYLHNRQPSVLVRDLKPDNIMLDDTGRIRLIDFGIARVLEPQVSTNTFLRGAGTPGFAPIEQYGGKTDPRTDIYALGATLYAVLTRRIPPPSVMRMSGEEGLVRPSLVNPKISLALEAALLRMMAVYREDRHANIEEVRTALRVAQMDFEGEDAYRYCIRCGTVRKSLDGPCQDCGARLDPGAIASMTRWLTDAGTRFGLGQAASTPPELPPVLSPSSPGRPGTPDTILPAASSPVSAGPAPVSRPSGSSAVPGPPGPGPVPGPPGADAASRVPAWALTSSPPTFESDRRAASADRGGLRRPMSRFATVVTALLALGVFGLAFLKVLERPRSGAGRVEASLIVSTMPEGARMQVDGPGATQDARRPQFVKGLTPGRYVLKFSREAYDPEEVTLTVERPEHAGAVPRLAVAAGRGKLPGTFVQVGSQGRLSLRLSASPGTLVVDVEPAGGDLYADGQVVERGVPRGAKVRLPAGAHKLELRREDYFSIGRAVQIESNKTVTWQAKLKSALCTVLVSTNPVGARVYMDGVLWGEAPRTLGSVKPMKHRLRFELPGYVPQEKEISPRPATQEKVAVTLVPRTGEIVLQVEPQGFSVFVDGQGRGQGLATGARLRVRPGVHVVTVRKDGYADLRRSVRVDADGQVVLEGRMTGLMASVEIHSSPPGAAVYVGQRSLGVTPISLPAVPPGTFSLRFEKVGYRPQHQRVHLVAGQRETVSVSLVEKPSAPSTHYRPGGTWQAPSQGTPARQPVRNWPATRNSTPSSSTPTGPYRTGTGPATSTYPNSGSWPTVIRSGPVRKR